MERSETPRDVWRRWEAEQASAIIDSINRVREARNLSLRQLVERLGEVGWPVSFGTLAGILSTKKRAGFTVAEVFAFARALEVPPGYLMLGLPAEVGLGGPVLPAGTSAGELLLWFRGELNAPRGEAIASSEADPVTEAAMSALQEADYVADVLRFARIENDILIAARSFPPGVLEEVLPKGQLDGSMLRHQLRNLQQAFDENAQAAGAIRPRLAAPESPFDVVLGSVEDVESIRVPLVMPETHDVSGVRARLAEVVDRRLGGRRRRSAGDDRA